MSPVFFGCTGLARSYCGASELSLSRSAPKPPKVDHTSSVPVNIAMEQMKQMLNRNSCISSVMLLFTT